MRSFIKIIYSFLSVICFMVLSLCAYSDSIIPDQITDDMSDDVFMDDHITFSVYNRSKKAAPANSALSDSRVNVEARLFGCIPIKNVEIIRTDRRYAAVCGTLFGIKLYTKGAAVVECCIINSAGVSRNPGQEAGLTPGDTLLEIDGIKITSCSQVERIVKLSDHEIFEIRYLHDNNEYTSTIHSVTIDGARQLGLWIKDSAAGLGTLTFYDPQTQKFAALGHGICDTDTGALLTLEQAQVTNVEVAGITKGRSGAPGSINGYFSDSPAFGSVLRNSECGVFGIMEKLSGNEIKLPIASPYEIYRGDAQILCTLDGGAPELYNIKITKIDHSSDTPTKNIQLSVTDPRLTEITGGIIQGMSGCPILQNGKLVGAVTHVLLTNSAKGYGIFAQKMYDEMEKAQN